MKSLCSEPGDRCGRLTEERLTEEREPPNGIRRLNLKRPLRAYGQGSRRMEFAV